MICPANFVKSQGGVPESLLMEFWGRLWSRDGNKPIIDPLVESALGAVDGRGWVACEHGVFADRFYDVCAAGGSDDLVVQWAALDRIELDPQALHD